MGAAPARVEPLPRWYSAAAAFLAAAGVAFVAYNLWVERRPEPTRLMFAEVAERSISLGVESCNADSHDVDIRESEVAVIIGVRSRGADLGIDCGDLISVVLDRPVGARAIVDGVTGEALVCEYDTQARPCRHLIAPWATE